jgi:hypothetical protein
MTALLAIGWEPELRGILIVIIAVGTLMGSVYLILATNLGARLGFLVTLASLAGWMFLMGMIWAVYGIGLRGKEPSWQAVPGRTVLQDNASLFNAGVFDTRLDVPADATPPEAAEVVAQEFVDEGWKTVGSEEPSFGQAASAAGVFLEETGAFAAGEFQAVNVFDTGGDRFPKIGDFDLVAFWHEPHHIVVEVAALEPTRTEAGRARGRPRAGRRRRRRDPPAPVRVHGPRPRHPSSAGLRAGHRRRADLRCPVLAPAPP